MDKPVLVVMAAGMGSRYGGLKQMDPMDDAGHVILDFSVYDAMLAGFEKVIFIIKKENEAEFRAWATGSQSVCKWNMRIRSWMPFRKAIRLQRGE